MNHPEIAGSARARVASVFIAAGMVLLCGGLMLAVWLF